TEDLDAVRRHGRLAGRGQLAVAAALGSEDAADGAGPHGVDGRARDADGRAPARNCGRRDDGVGARDVLAEHRLLARLLLARELARVAAGAFARDARVDELRAERLHLLARGAAHIVAFDHRAQAPGRRDGLQPRDAG